MTTSDLERRLAEVLHRHAENAMNKTHTDERLQTLLVDAERDARRRRRAWGAGALAAAAAAVALIVWAAGLGSDETETAPPAQRPNAEAVATAFLDAYGSFDRERAASYLAPSADSDAWRLDNRWYEATGYRLLLRSCEKQPGSIGGTQVRCAYDYHALRSDELGRGPFSGSVFTITVRDGKIVAVDDGLEFESNGFSAQMWEPFAAWVAEAHPEDAAVMYADWPNTTLQALDDRSIALWGERTADYVAIEQGNTGTGTSG